MAKIIATILLLGLSIATYWMWVSEKDKEEFDKWQTRFCIFLAAALASIQ